MSSRCFKLEPNGAMKQYERGNAGWCQVADGVQGQGQSVEEGSSSSTFTVFTLLLQLCYSSYPCLFIMPGEEVSYRKRCSAVAAGSTTDQFYSVWF